MKRKAPFLFLIAGLGLAFWLWRTEQHDQHVRFVLGNVAPRVTHLSVDYDGNAGTELSWPIGSAPRIVGHDPRLPDGSYHLRIDVDLREGRKTVERQVTLAGGTTSVDLVDSLGP